MGERKGKWGWWIALGVIVALLLACFVGGLAGGLAGYFAGRRAARSEQLPRLYGYRASPGRPLPEVETPVPRLPEGFGDFDFTWQRGGALVLSVVEDSPAEDAGLRRGDVIVEVDGKSLGEGKTLAEVISRYEPGDEVELQIVRRGRERTIEVELGQHPDKPARAPWLGIEYRTSPRFEFRFETPDEGESRPDIYFD